MKITQGLRYHFTCEKCRTTTSQYERCLEKSSVSTLGMGEVMGAYSSQAALSRLGSDAKIEEDLNKQLQRQFETFNAVLSNNDRIVFLPKESFLAQIYNETFSSHICPHCGHAQTWYPAISELPSRLRSARAWAIGFALLGIVTDMVVHGFILYADWNILLYGGAGALLGAAIGALKASAKKRKLDKHWNSVTIHNKPIVEWGEIATDEHLESPQESDDDNVDF